MEWKGVEERKRGKEDVSRCHCPGCQMWFTGAVSESIKGVCVAL